jgi:hypothetical protein
MVRAGVGISVVNPLTALEYAESGIAIRPFSLSVPFTVSLIHASTLIKPLVFALSVQQPLPGVSLVKIPLRARFRN